MAAQTPVAQRLPGVHIEYKEPTNTAHRPIYDRLRKRQVLEQFREFMSPLRMKHALVVSLEGCGGDINAYYSNGLIKYCYEYIAHTQRLVAVHDVLPVVRREDAIVGEFVSVLLHETAHAIFHLFNIPVFGREEDAADAVASYVSLQFGRTTARRILTGTAFVWHASELERQKGATRRFQDYSDEHGTDAQRFYNVLCIALGSDMVGGTGTFKDFEELLPPRRLVHCPREYDHIRRSFALFIRPHIDEARLKYVQTQEWLRSDDGKDILPPKLPPFKGKGPGGPGPTKFEPK